RMGNTERLSTDIGPVIDAEAKAGIEHHIQTMYTQGKTVYQAVYENDTDSQEWSQGTFVKPTLIELDSFAELQKEIFGPVLHVVRFKRHELDKLLDQI
ncbi:aldehyde dehydrogenase family protein, partial [Enterobacter hormaechei]|nr:aldehyde dehydrogenase family protein [Enterobacter hormaechei]